ncbi:hypothetical protein LTR56_003407 [Elasticomyces elasticus]|nr:hypothetical protein LTR56_003407 [Elasticomyces elasticus]KAK3664174.1 hypothetical protein LTR22_004872 [Elasticomyces elasticus]KAK4931389.1 hypothetical protein LTR49_002090 [Elasticomyces elasticus]KAK5766091.1 hypothetical protein LTS12_003837 [Elasticomyces elasticus]
MAASTRAARDIDDFRDQRQKALQPTTLTNITISIFEQPFKHLTGAMADLSALAVAAAILSSAAYGILWAIPWMIFWTSCFITAYAIGLISIKSMKSIYQVLNARRALVHETVPLTTLASKDDIPFEYLTALLADFAWVAALSYASHYYKATNTERPSDVILALGCILVLLAGHVVLLSVFGLACFGLWASGCFDGGRSSATTTRSDDYSSLEHGLVGTKGRLSA